MINQNLYSVLKLANSVKSIEGERSILRNFSLEEFVKTYIEEANKLSVLRLHTDKFDRRLRQNVASRLMIRREVVRYLEHPFYWDFLYYNSPTILGVKPFTTLLNPFSSSNTVEQTSTEFINKYGLYLRSRLCNLCNSY